MTLHKRPSSVRTHRCRWPLGIALVWMLLTPLAVVDAAPFSSEGIITGTIEGMWLDSDGCYLRIHISWSDCEAWRDTAVNAVALFLDESAGAYILDVSSRGWRVGDTIDTAVLKYDAAERSSVYIVLLDAKSDENFAEPLGFLERNPLVVYLLLLGAVFLLWVVVRNLLFGKRGRSELDQRNDGYLRFFRRM